MNLILVNGLAISLETFWHKFMNKRPNGKLIFYEDIIHPYRVQSMNSLFRFNNSYWPSSNRPIWDSINYNDIIDKNWTLDDLNNFIGSLNNSEIWFKRHNKWITKQSFDWKFIFPFTSWTAGWETEIYQGQIWDEFLNKPNDHDVDQNKILNSFRFFNEKLEWNWFWNLYNRNRDPYDFYKNFE